MVTAIVLLNVARTQVNAVAKSLAEMVGISEGYSVNGELDLAAIVSVATNEDQARALGQAFHTAHVVIETAQFLYDQPGLGRWLCPSSGPGATHNWGGHIMTELGHYQRSLRVSPMRPYAEFVIMEGFLPEARAKRGGKRPSAGRARRMLDIIASIS